MSAGKGSSPRPYSIPADEYAEKHAAIFGAPRKREPYIPPPLPKEVDERNNSSENEVSPVRTVFGLASSLKMYRPALWIEPPDWS